MPLNQSIQCCKTYVKQGHPPFQYGNNLIISNSNEKAFFQGKPIRVLSEVKKEGRDRKWVKGRGTKRGIRVRREEREREGSDRESCPGSWSHRLLFSHLPDEWWGRTLHTHTDTTPWWMFAPMQISQDLFEYVNAFWKNGFQFRIMRIPPKHDWIPISAPIGPQPAYLDPSWGEKQTFWCFPREAFLWLIRTLNFLCFLPHWEQVWRQSLE